MSVLLVDIGNTRIKWARWSNGRLGRMRAGAYAGWRAADFAQRVFAGAAGVERVLAVSVAGTAVERQFAAAARSAVGEAPEFALSERRAAGVVTRYTDTWRLGSDRFVAAIGAHHFAGSRAACAVCVGTTMTLDLVDGRGVHRGGAIVPGPELMMRSLLQGTHGIGRRAAGAAGGRRFFARNTREAIEQGARHAAAAVIDHAVLEARGALGRTPLLLLTGGGARGLVPLLHSAAVIVPDLVLRGLALRAGLAIPAGRGVK